MSQALHIFRKDVRHLWIEIAVALLSIGLFIYTASRSPWGWHAPMPQTLASFLISGLLPIACWTLIVRAVHGETLVGDREFWTTRPYNWRSLLAAKALFFVAFINLPMLIAQIVVVSMHGFSLAETWAGLLWSQVLFTVAFILPVAAVACLTASIVQFLIIALLAFVVMVLLSFRFFIFAAAFIGAGWGPMDWINVYYDFLVIAIAALAILAWQYARRRTWQVRALALTALVVFIVGSPIPWTTAFALQSHLSPHPIDTSAVRAGFNRDFQWMTRARIERSDRVSIHIPLQVAGLADDFSLRAEGLTAEIAAAAATWHVNNTGRLISMETTVDRVLYERVKGQPAQIRGWLYLTVYGNRRYTELPFDERPTRVPGMGICAASRRQGPLYFLACDSVFRPSADLVSVRFEKSEYETGPAAPPRQLSYSPFPADLSIDPILPYSAFSTFNKFPVNNVKITTLEPMAHIRIPLEIDGLILGKYEVRL